MNKHNGTTVSHTDFTRYVNEVADVDELVLVNDRRKTDNPIIEEYSDATLQAYLYLLDKNGINFLCSFVSFFILQAPYKQGHFYP